MATTQQGVIKKFMAALDKTKLIGTAAIDEAVQACSNFNSISEVIDKMVSDCRTVNNAENFLKNYCGIDLYNSDTGAITGLDAGGTTVKTAESIVPEVGSLKTYKKNSFTTNGVTFKLVKFDDNYRYVDTNFNSLTDSQKYMWQAFYTWWAPNALSLISSSYGDNFGFTSKSSATTTTINFGFYENDSDSLQWTMSYNIDGKTTDLVMAINTDYYSNLDKSNVNGYDYVSQEAYLDRTMAHELTHAVMMANVNHFNELPNLITEGMAELTSGTDDVRTDGILTLAGNSNLLNQALVLSPEYNYFGPVWASDYVGGYMLLRYLAYQAANGTDSLPANFSIFTDSNDYYINNTPNTILSALKGNDTIENYVDSVKVNGDAGKDFLYNERSYVTLNGGSGNDTITNLGYYADSVKIDAGSGNDIIKNYFHAENVTIYAGNGNDSIDNGNYCDGTKIDAGNGNDTISSSWSDNLTIKSGKGNDLILLDNNSGRELIEYASGDGNDTIYGYNLTDTVKLTNVSVSGSSIVGDDIILNVGNDSIRFIGTNAVNVNGKIYGSSTKGTNGNDFIANVDSNVTLSGYKGNDKFSNIGSDVVINTGNGNNSVWSSGYNTTINAGNGKDTIYISGVGSKINAGSGNDSIDVGWTYGTTVKAGAGNDKIYNYASNVTIDGGAGNDSICSYGDYNTIDGGSGNDTINSDFNWSGKILGGAGNDSIYSYGDCNTIDGGTGNDTIDVYGYGNSINGGAGNDKISLSGGHGNSVIGGKGNDTIYGDSTSAVGSVYQYAKGDGNDIIYGYKSSDVVSITGGTFTTSTVENNVLVKVGGSGTITLVGAKGKDINVYPKSFTPGNDYCHNSTSDITLSALAGNDKIYNNASNVTIDGGAGNDSIYSYDSYFNTIDGGAGNDSICSYGSYNTIDGGAGNDSIYSYGSYNTIDGGSGNDTINSDYNWSGKILGGAGNDSIYSYGDYNTIDGGKGNDTIDVYYSYHNSINGGAGNDKISLSSNSDGTIIGGKGNDTIYGDSTSTVGSTYQYANGDGNDIIYGYKSSDVVSITGGTFTTSTVKNNVLVKVGGSGTITLVGAKGKDINFASDQFGEDNDYYINDTSNTVLSALAGNDTIYNDGWNNSINGGAGNDSIYSYGSYNTIDGGSGNDTINSDYNWSGKILGGAGNDSIYSYGDYNTIDGGKGNDTIDVYGYDNSINGGAGNDKISLSSNSDGTIIGGKGNDTIYGDSTSTVGSVYQYAKGDGNDIIYGYKSDDTINITSGNYTKSTVGNDVILTVGSGKITLAGAKGETINIKKGKISNAATSYNNLSTKSSSQSLTSYSSHDNANSSIAKNKYINPTKNNGSKISKSYNLYAGDNNFANDNLQIDSVMNLSKSSYSVDKIESPNRYLNLTQQDSLQAVYSYAKR